MTTDQERFQAATGVSRETLERLEGYAALLSKWNAKINLVAAGTLPDLWTRHFLDSAQLLQVAPRTVTSWVDMGSGAGFPGVVVAAIAADRPGFQMTLIESDKRKAEFLRAALRALGLSAEVFAQRIESVPGSGAEVVSARALAPLDKLLDYAKLHLGEGGIGLFPKGRTAMKEIEDARARWSFRCDIHPSRTDSEAVILEIGEISRV